MSLFLETIKLLAETITASSTALIVLLHLVGKLPDSVKRFFTKDVPVFFCGHTSSAGKKLWFFKAVEAAKENREQMRNIVSMVAPDLAMEEILVLNQQELSRFLSESKLSASPRRPECCGYGRLN